MRCPKCKQTESFKTDMWEVDTFTADLDGGDITHCKHDDCQMSAIDSEGATKCSSCGYENATCQFTEGKEAFPVLRRPTFEELENRSQVR